MPRSTMQATNRGAWLPYKQARPLQVDDAPMPRPGPDEVIVKVHAVAINPADVAVQSLGIVYNDFPVIIGCDAAGEVIDLGTDVENYEKGDRVLVSVFKGAFQLYTTVKVPFAVKLPRSIACKDACVMGLGLATAMLHIFETDMLALRLPRVINPAPTDEVVLVWGGSSSVGSCAIQLAVAAGYDVVAIASERNFDYCRSIGASNCFDYKLGNAVSETAGALEGKKIAGSFCALASEEVLAECAQIVDRCSGNKVLSTVIPAFLPITIKIPDSVKLCQSGRIGLHDSPIVQGLFRDWVSPALANGSLRTAPVAEVVGRGLDDIQAAIDRVAQGVSAKKIVVELQ